MKPTQLADYASPLGLGAAAYAGLWLGACMKAAETGAGIAWNAPGLAGPLGVPLPEALLAACFRHSDHVALREPSHLPVSGPNAIEGLQIVPDPVVALSDVWPEADLATLLPDLSARYALAPSYTVFHAKQRNLRDRAGIATARTLLARLEVAGPVLLVPFGRVHQDDLALSELVHGLPGRFRLAGPELTLRETTALIAGARLVVSASLHGAIVATAYGVPVRLLAVQGMAKYRAFFDQLDRPEVVVDSWNLMGPAVIEALAAPRSPRPYAAMAQVRQFYADVWAALTTERDRAARGLELRRLVARLCRREMPIAHFIPSAALLVSSS